MATLSRFGVGEVLALILVHVDVVGIVTEARDEEVGISGDSHSHLAIAYECMASLHLRYRLVSVGQSGGTGVGVPFHTIDGKGIGLHVVEVYGLC